MIHTKLLQLSLHACYGPAVPSIGDVHKVGSEEADQGSAAHALNIVHSLHIALLELLFPNGRDLLSSLFTKHQFVYLEESIL